MKKIVQTLMVSFFCGLILFALLAPPMSWSEQGKLPSESEVLRAAKVPNDEQRIWACEYLGQYQDQAALEAIKQLAHDPQPAVRSASAMAIVQSAASKEDLLPLLQALAKDPEPSVRAAVASNLWRCSPSPISDEEQYKIFKLLVRDKKAPVRASAIESINSGFDVEDEELLRLSNDSESYVREAVAGACVRSGVGRKAVDSKVANALLKMTEDPELRVRVAAIHALGCVDQPSKLVQAALLKYAKTGNFGQNMQQEALWALGYQLEENGIIYTPAIHTFLICFCDSTKPGIRLRAFEAMHLATRQPAMSAAQKKQIRAMAQKLSEDPDSGVRERVQYLALLNTL